MLYLITSFGRDVYVYDSEECDYGVCEYSMIYNVYKSNPSLFGAKQLEYFDYLPDTINGVGGLIITDGVCAVCKDNEMLYWYNDLEYNFIIEYSDYTVSVKIGGMTIHYHTSRFSKGFYLLPLRNKILLSNSYEYKELFEIKIKEDLGISCTHGNFLRRVMLGLNLKKL